jgi:hypothetical protein
MAAQSTLSQTALSIRYKDGVDANGKDVIKTRKFTNVKVMATAQNIYDTAAAFGQLMKYPITEVVRTDDTVLTNV